MNTTPDTKPSNKETWEIVTSLPIERLRDYWITKFGYDWVLDDTVHANYFDSVLAMHMQFEGLIDVAQMLNPGATPHWPNYRTSYKIKERN